MPVNLPEELRKAEAEWAHLWTAQMIFAFTGEDCQAMLSGELQPNFDKLVNIDVSCMRCGEQFQPGLIGKICRGRRVQSLRQPQKGKNNSKRPQR